MINSGGDDDGDDKTKGDNPLGLRAANSFLIYYPPLQNPAVPMDESMKFWAWSFAWEPGCSYPHLQLQISRTKLLAMAVGDSSVHPVGSPLEPLEREDLLGIVILIHRLLTHM